jgi:acetylornithine deacetylase/succinyl-diaminopimelate desuccinylase-like protein
MAEISAPYPPASTLNTSVARLAFIDGWLKREASGWLKKARKGSDLLGEARSCGWQVQAWGDTVFGQLQDGPAGLLFYIPPGEAGKTNLAALLAAAQSWQTGRELPLTLKFLWGPLDEKLLAAHRSELAADAIVYAEGEYRQGRPLLSLGVKGLLEVELRVKTMSKDAPSAFSEIMPGASWLLVQAIAALKSDSQEVQIEDFDEDIIPLPVEESVALRQAAPDFGPELAGRLRDYGLDEYIFSLNDRLVLQTQFMVPTVNVAALECGSFTASGRLKLPATARARLDFLLVPFQSPDAVFEKLRQHLLEKDFSSQLEIIRLPGAQRPSRTPLSARFVQATLEAGEALGQPPLVAPIALFTGPLADLKEALGNPPAVCFGLGQGRVSLSDFKTQARWLAHLFPLVQGGDAAMFEIYPDRPVERLTFAAKKIAAPAQPPDLSDLSELIPDFPELDLEIEPFGLPPEDKPGNPGRF